MASLRRCILLGWLWVAACGDGEGTLLVDLISDVVPGVEASAARASLEQEGRPSLVVRFALDREVDLAGGVRIATFEALGPGTYRLAVELLDARDTPVVARPFLVDVGEETFAVRAVLSRRCRGVSCGAGEACVGGTCIDASCGPEGCREPSDCAEDLDCPALSSCSRGRCAHGSCLQVGNDRCDATQYCDPDRGCVDLPGLDAGTDAGGDAGRDAGADASLDAGFDAGVDAGSDAGECATEGATCDDRNICTSRSTCQAGACVGTPLVSTCVVATSTSEFSSNAQGEAGWYYGYWHLAADPDGTYDPLLDFVEMAYLDDGWRPPDYTPTVGFTWCYLQWWGGHPGATPLKIPVRRWVSDVTGQATISVTHSNADTGGDGTRPMLIVDGALLWQMDFAGSDGAIHVEEIEVELAIGTRVDLLVHPRSDDAVDTFESSVEIRSAP